jgi:hypothetical protein
MESAEIAEENRSELIPYVTGQLTISSLLSQLSGPSSPTTAIVAEVEPTPENEIVPEGRITLREFADRQSENFVGMMSRVEDHANHAVNGDRLVSMLGIGSLAYFLRAPLIAAGHASARFGQNSFNSFIGLSRVTFQFGANHPIAFGSLMLAGAATTLYLESKMQEGLDTVTVPEDPEALKQEILAFLVNSEQWQAISSTITPEQMAQFEEALLYVTDQEKFNQLIDSFNPSEFLNHVKSEIISEAGLSETERIISTNSMGLRNFDSVLRLHFQSRSEEYADMRTYLTQIESGFILGQNVTAEKITEMINFFRTYGVEIFEDETGYIRFSIIDSNGVAVFSELALFVNSSQPIENQYEKARWFISDVEQWNGFAGTSNMVMGDVREVIDTLQNDGIIAVVGDSVFSVFSNTFVRLGPISIAKDILDALSAEISGEDSAVEVHEALFEWTNGMVPMMILGLPRAVAGFVSGTATSGPVIGVAHFMSRLLGSALLWPVTVTKMTINSARLAFSAEYRAITGHRLKVLSQESRQIVNLYEARRMLKFRVIPGASLLTDNLLINWQRNFEARINAAGYQSLGTSHNYSSLTTDNARALLAELDTEYARRIGISSVAAVPTNAPTSTVLAPRTVVPSQQLTDAADEAAENFAPRSGVVASSGVDGLRSVGNVLTQTRTGRAAVATTVIGAGVGGLAYVLGGSNDVETPLSLETIDRVDNDVEASNESLEVLYSQAEAQETVDSDLEFLSLLSEENRPYREVRDFLNPTNLASLSEDNAFSRIQDLGHMHELQVQKIITLVRDNKADIIRFLTENRDIPALYYAEQNLSIALDLENNSDLKIEYTSTDAFCNLVWGSYDSIRMVESLNSGEGSIGLVSQMRAMQDATMAEIEVISSNTELSEQEKFDQIVAQLETYQTHENELMNQISEYSRRVSSGGIAMDMIPFVGGYRDLQRVSTAIERGNWWQGALNSASFVVGSLGDIFTFGGASLAMRTARVVNGLARVSSTLARSMDKFSNGLSLLRSSRLLNSGVANGIASVMDFAIRKGHYALIGAVGLDVGRYFLVPFDLDESVTI